MSPNSPLIFALDDDPQLGRKIAEHLTLNLSPLELREFPDSEFKIRPLSSVRNRTVFVIMSLTRTPNHSVHDCLCRLLFFISCLRDHGAAQVYALIPYLCYARKDRRTKSRDPLTLRYVAQLLEAVQITGLIGLEVHNEAAFANALRCPAHLIDSAPLFADHLAPILTSEQVTFVSPDLGGMRRVEHLRQTLLKRHSIACHFGWIDKERNQDRITIHRVIGELEGQTVVIFDDLISTGTTIVKAVEACRARGAAQVIVGVTHGLFYGGIPKQIMEAPIDRMLITNSLPWTPPERRGDGPIFECIDSSMLWAKVIQAISGSGSLSALAISNAN